MTEESMMELCVARFEERLPYIIMMEKVWGFKPGVPDVLLSLIHI